MTNAYQIVSMFYGDKRAKRSQVPLMQHIDEGLRILDLLQAPWAARESFCLHPILQEENPEEFVKNFDWLESFMCPPSAYILAVTMEYCSVANAYLPRHAPSQTRLNTGRLDEVRLMLIADKVQNRMDFEIHHKGTHPNSERLDQYFKEWLDALNISEAAYQEFKRIVKGNKA